MTYKEELTKLLMESYDRGVADAKQEVLAALEKAASAVRADERKAVLDTIDELMGMERDRHPMFSDGYDHALQHIAQFVRGRENT